ncbi:MAG: hypothetical protein P8N76_28230 [Pirellulaceae bacterium]|nr:hypothetical protein [Pirellulaceae bacterium]
MNFEFRRCEGATISASDTMNCGRITISAPARLHFGLLSFGNPNVRQYGGVGVMVDNRSISLAAEPHTNFMAEGPLSERIAEFAQRWKQYYELELPHCRLQLLHAPAQHVGLGVGTQLALSVATVLHTLRGEAVPEVPKLAQSVGRGQRSCIGSYGFSRGGLLFELGKQPEETFATLADRIELPESWRVVQIRSNLATGISGPVETKAFKHLPAVPASTTQSLINEVTTSMLPAARCGDFDQFSESVYRYGFQAGQCFAEQQGGPFANRQLESWVAAIRKQGFAGVGQSSWGPTLFVFQPSQDDALAFMNWFRQKFDAGTEIDLTSSSFNNRGVEIQVLHAT